MTARRTTGTRDPAGSVRLLALVAVLSACFRFPHPEALTGQWVDSARTNAADTSVWILKPNGDDLALRIGAPGDSGGRASSPRLYGRWYLSGELADTAGRALCFTQRPGRDAPSCVRFRLDTVVVNGALRRRLTLSGYLGAHATSDRVLIARRP